MRKLFLLALLIFITGCETPEWKVKQDKAAKESDTTIYITSGKYSNTYYTKRKTIEFPTPTCIQCEIFKSSSLRLKKCELQRHINFAVFQW